METKQIQQVPVVELSHLFCRFGRTEVLSDLSLTVPLGESLGIVGRNGAGKTTLIDLICGLLQPSAGSIRLFGESVENKTLRHRRHRARIGVVSQETALYTDVSAEQNLRFAAALYGVRNPSLRITEVLKLVDLTARREDPVRSFSGGMQRRLALARALLHEPELLVLDEPTVGIDAQTRHEIWSHVRDLKRAGKTVIMTTNYLDEAEAVCDRVVVLQAGGIVADAAPLALSRQVGICLELVCSRESHGRPAQETLAMNELAKSSGVHRVERVENGLIVYLSSALNPEDVVAVARRHLEIKSFQARSPDLADIFQHFRPAAPAAGFSPPADL